MNVIELFFKILISVIFTIFLFAGNCERTEHGDFVYWPKIIKSYIRLGVNDFDKELANLKVYEIEKIIRPKKAYPSGGYRVRKKYFQKKSAIV